MRVISELTCALRELVNQKKEELEHSRSVFSFVTKLDLRKIAKDIMAKLDDLVKAGTELSTATDTLSNTVDKLSAAADRVVTALQDADLPDAAAKAVENLKTVTAEAVAARERADAEVTKLDTILPTPAPAGKS